jgi:hypothetical protein
MWFNTKTVFSFIAGFLIILSLIISPAAAVKVEGAKIMLDVKPGTTYIFPMAVSSKPEDAPADYAVEVYGFGQSVEGGSYTPLTAADDTGANSARALVTMDFPVVHIDRGQRRAFNATIRVPQNIGEGGRYALIHIHPAAAGGGQTGFATAIIVPVMLTVQNTKLVETGTITEISVGDIVAGKPITVATTLKNTGNHHYYGVVNQVTVTDSAGKSVATAKADAMSNAVIPGQSVRFNTLVSNPLAVGTYTVKSDMQLESGAILDSRTTSITVKEAYVPPFQQSSAKVTPDSPATLEVPEGTVRISFPQGAVLAETTVTVKPYIGTLPDLPAGAKAGTTAFSVDGLSGLLAKDATVTVRYNKADLDAANSDASKLVLGRYDRGEAHWTLLPTTVDRNAMTLTASTNRFSTWAVIAAQSSGQTSASGASPMAAATQSPAPGPLLICGLISLILLARSARKR